MYSLHNYCTYSISKLLQGIIYPVSHRKIVTVRNISRYIDVIHRTIHCRRLHCRTLHCSVCTVGHCTVHFQPWINYPVSHHKILQYDRYLLIQIEQIAIHIYKCTDV